MELKGEKNKWEDTFPVFGIILLSLTKYNLNSLSCLFCMMTFSVSGRIFQDAPVCLRQGRDKQNCSTLRIHVSIKETMVKSARHPDGATADSSLALVCAILQDTSDERPLPKQGGDIGALVQRLLFEISRHRCWMDWLIDGCATRRSRPRLRRVLWWSLAQLFFMDGLPAPVVVDTACRFVKRRYAPNEASFVNAILRKIADMRENGAVPPIETAPPFVRAGLPELLFERWRRQLGLEETMRMGQLLQTEAPVVCRRKRYPERKEQVCHGLEVIPPFDWCPGQEFLKSTGRQTKIPLDSFYIQDPSTALAVEMRAVEKHQTVADLCAAPGGKALLLAEILQGTGRLVCCDKSPERLEKVRENLRDFSNVSISCEDALQNSLPRHSFDTVLVDVPCTNTGVIRRRPDARWTFSKEKLKELVELQMKILEAAITLVKPGGRVVYSTCSVESEEDEAQIDAFLAAHPDVACIGQRKLWPDENHDGAFAASLLVRRR